MFSVFLALVATSTTPTLAGEFKGRLLVGDRPATGISVSAVPYETPFEEARREARRGAPPRPIVSARTGADGAFALTVPAAAAGQSIRFTFEGRGIAPVMTEGVYDSAESEDLGEQSLPRGGPVAGRVVGADGTPVAGAEVKIVASRGGRFESAGDVVSLPRWALTSVDGTFRFDDASSAGNRITVEARGFAVAEVTGVRSGALSRPIVMAPGVSLSGVVRNNDRKTPAAGALVRFEGRSTSRWVEAGPDGAFRISDLHAGGGILVADGGEAGLAEMRDVTVPDPAAKVVAVTLTPGAVVEGRVVDEKTQRPVARARITARSGSLVRVTRSGPDGLYRLSGLFPLRYRIEADEPRYVPFARDGLLVTVGATEKVDLPLTLGSTLSGRVVDEDGTPVAAARGTLSRGGEAGFGAILRELRGGERSSFRSAPDGSFKATRLPPGENQRLTVTHGDFERKTVSGLSLPAGGTRSNVTVVLQRGLSLIGLVRDENGQPIPGAEARLNQTRTFRGGRGGNVMQLVLAGGPDSRERTESGPDGRFEIKGLSAGEYSLTVQKPGYTEQTLDPVKVGEGAVPVEVTLSAGASISGIVMQPNGNGVEGQLVRARARGRFNEGPMGTGTREPTGPDGFFTIEGLKAGETYDLEVMGGSGLGPRREGVTAPAEGVELVVAGRGRITGRVVETPGGQPVTDFEVSYAPDRSGGGVGFVVRMGGPGGRRRGGFGEKEAVHSEEGFFVLEDVPVGRWDVNVEAKGFQPARVSGVVVEAGITKDVEVKAARGNALRGVVLDARSGRPVPNAGITADPSGAGGPRGPMMLFDEGGSSSDADGRFEVDGLSPGMYRVTARHPEYAEASELVDVRGAAAVTIRLSTGGVLAGSVLSETRRPLPAAEVALTAAGEGGMLAGPRGMLAMGNRTLTDEAGRFRFEHLSAGRYTATASVRGRSSAPLEVVLQPGESREDLMLSLSAGATIHGVVSGLADSMRAGVNVSASGAESYFGSARTDSDGSFELAGVPAGALTLRATAGDMLGGSTRTATAQVQVPEGQTDVSAEIAFQPGYTLTGTVTRGGAAVSDAIVSASPQGGGGIVIGPGGGSASSRTDASGGYRLEGLLEGRYSVTAMPTRGGSPQRQTVSISGDATLDLAIPVARLGGTVVEASSKLPLSDALVQLESRDESGSAFARMSPSDSNGRFAIEDLDPKSYTLTVRKAGYLFEKRQVAAAEQGTDELVLELTRGEGIGVQARDGIFGFPLQDLTARALDAQRTPVFMGGVPLDSEGRGEIPSLKPGRYSLFLDASGYAPVSLDVQVPSPTLAVALTPGGHLEVHTSPGSVPPGGFRCQILGANGAPYAFAMFSPDGRFVVSTAVRRIENIASGSYTLSVEGGKPATFTIAEGGTSVVDLPVP
jgi:protocatechuate 3,4-dioxygenase beta subunit